ncbi:MAG TPA: NUDIX domain-containing protein [Caldilineaceae bacterium]|nr:NUDIX domain-containing protein [Caldilineaceae bacterium]
MTRLLLRLAYQLYRLHWLVLRPVTLGVRLILISDETGIEQVVLVRHTYQPGWHLPGGAIHRGERPDQAAMREGVEEAGAHLLEPPRLLGVHSSFEYGQSNHVLTFVSRSFRLERPTDRWEIADRAAFPLDDLPADVTAGTRRRIEEYRAGEWPLLGRW